MINFYEESPDEYKEETSKRGRKKKSTTTNKLNKISTPTPEKKRPVGRPPNPNSKRQFFLERWLPTRKNWLNNKIRMT